MAHFNTCRDFTHPWSYNWSIFSGNSHTTSFPSSPCGNQHNEIKLQLIFVQLLSTDRHEQHVSFSFDPVILRNTTTLKMNCTNSSIDHISHILENGQNLREWQLLQFNMALMIQLYWSMKYYILQDFHYIGQLNLLMKIKLLPTTYYWYHNLDYSVLAFFWSEHSLA